MQRTFSIIKPDAVKRHITGEIIAKIQGAGLEIIAMKMLHLTREQAEGFYAVHKGKPFFERLMEYMCSGPIVCLVLEAEDAIVRYRTLMGATNPEEADEGTLRKIFALNKTQNSVHGSDADETATVEIAYFFNSLEIYRI